MDNTRLEQDFASNSPVSEKACAGKKGRREGGIAAAFPPLRKRVSQGA
jgi:hypothetical protein